MTKQLIIIRHGHSPRGRNDHARELDETGRRESAEMAQRLQESGCVPHRWLASDAVRVRQTLEAVADELGAGLVDQSDGESDGEVGAESWSVDWRNGLYLADRETLLEHLWAMPGELGVDRPVGLAGHNPGLSELTSWLTGVQTKLPTGGTVLLTGPEPEQAERPADQSWGLAAKRNRWSMTEFWRPTPA